MTLSYWDVWRDSWVSEQSPSTKFGAGLGLRLQSGFNSGSPDYKNRFFIGWLKPAAVPNDATIIAATAFLKVRGNPGSACFGQGGAPKLLVRRVTPTSYVPKENGTGAASECALGTGDGGDGTGRWPGPDGVGGTAMSATNMAFWQGTPSTGDVISIDITDQFKDWWAARAGGDSYYTAMFLPSNAAGTAEEQITGRKIAFHAADGTTALFDGGNGPYLLVEYSTASAPSAPTLTSPANASRVTQPGSTRALGFTYVHPDGDAGTDYNVKVATNVGMTTVVCDKTVALAMANNAAVNVPLSTTVDFSPAEVRGNTYYWQVRTRANATWGAWSAVRNYVVNRLPTVTVTSPP